MDSDNEWFTAGTVFEWFWGRLFTRLGLIAFLCAWIATALWLGHSAGGSLPSYGIFFLIFPFASFLIAILLVLCTTFGDAIADWVASAIFRGNLRSTSILHQIIYFILSCLGLTLCAIIFSMGDSASVPFIP